MKMSEFIEFSNFMLINFWWIILPICFFIGFLIYFINESFNNEITDEFFIDNDIKWDRYGNPIIGEDKDQK
jgi:hypothetical protein